MNRSLILCAHGTQSSRGSAAIAGLVGSVRRRAGDVEVLDAFVDVQSPSLAAVMQEAAGLRIMVPVTPTYDPAMTAQDLDVTVIAPLGPDWVMAEVGVRRLFEAGARSDDTIVLAAGAASDRRAAADVGKAARLLSAVWGGPVHVGTLGGPDTTLGDAIDIARAYVRRVVVSTYVLTAGAMYDAISAAGADIVTAPLLNEGRPDPRLVNLVLVRARKMWADLGQSAPQSRR